MGWYTTFPSTGERQISEPSTVGAALGLVFSAWDLWSFMVRWKNRILPLEWHLFCGVAVLEKWEHGKIRFETQSVAGRKWENPSWRTDCSMIILSEIFYQMYIKSITNIQDFFKIWDSAVIFSPIWGWHILVVVRIGLLTLISLLDIHVRFTCWDAVFHSPSSRVNNDMSCSCHPGPGPCILAICNVYPISNHMFFLLAVKKKFMFLRSQCWFFWFYSGIDW